LAIFSQNRFLFNHSQNHVNKLCLKIHSWWSKFKAVEGIHPNWEWFWGL